MILLCNKIESLLRKMPHALHNVHNDYCLAVTYNVNPLSDLAVAIAVSLTIRVLSRDMVDRNEREWLYNTVHTPADPEIGKGCKYGWQRQSSSLSSKKTCQDRVVRAVYG